MRIEDNDMVIEYLDNICSNIKNKRMHKEIREELLCHIEESVLINIKIENDEETAIKKAIENMGDYKTVSKDLNIIHKPSIDWTLIFSSMLILIIGLTSIYFASSDINISPFRRALLFSFIGIIALLLSSSFNYIKLKIYSKYIYVFSLLLLVISYFSSPVSWYRAFLVIGPFSINILEITPIILLISLCNLIKDYSKCKDKMDFLEVYALYFIPIIFMLPFKNIACISIYFVGICSLLKIKKFKNKHIIIPVIICFALFLLSLNNYRLDRLTAFLYPSSDSLGMSYVYNQIHTILSNSVLLGEANNFSSNLLPGFEGDFIFTFIIYKFGFLSGFITITLCTFLLFKISKSLLKVKNLYNKSLITVILSTLGVKYVYGILMNLGMLPTTGISIPFLSYGGNSSIINFILIGLILNIYKVKNLSNIENLTTCND